MGILDGIRQYLEHNKIFFETIVMLCLTIASITVTIVAVDLDSQQLEREKLENQPFFHIYNEYIFDDEYTVVSETLTIENIASPASEFDADVYSFLYMRCNDRNNNLIGRVQIPILGYYRYSFITGKLTGEMANFKPPIHDENNFLKIRLATTMFNEILLENEYDGTVFLETYIHVEYLDIYGEQHNDIYQFYGNKYHKLSPQEADKIKKIYDDRYRIGISLGDLESIDIWDLFVEHVD